MGRGVSSGGGQSSLGYLFGSGETPLPSATPGSTPVAPSNDNNAAIGVSKGAFAVNKIENGGFPSDVAAGTLAKNPNNYLRADGQNTGNFITERPSTKVHSAPGGGSSLGYLFGGS